MVSIKDLRSLTEGVAAIPVTPFRQTGEVDEEALETIVGRIIGSGADVIVACGNTSEHFSLTADERERVAAVTIRAAKDTPVLVGVGGDLNSAITELDRAVALGAVGVMVHYPTHPYLSSVGLADYYSALAGSTEGAIVPYVRGPGLPTAVIDRIAAIPNVVAVKYAIPDPVAFGEFAARYGSALVPVCGLAELWAPFFWLCGARGFTSGLVNVAPRLSREMRDALRHGDYTRAMELWRVIEPFERLRARHQNGNNVPVVKEALERLGLAASSVRPPLARLSDADREELEHLLPVLREWA